MVAELRLRLLSSPASGSPLGTLWHHLATTIRSPVQKLITHCLTSKAPNRNAIQASQAINIKYTTGDYSLNLI